MKIYSIEEFKSLIENSIDSYEYVEGEVFLMAEPSFRHSEIAFNIQSKMNSMLKRPCYSYVERYIYISTRDRGIFYKPDVLITCRFDVHSGNYLMFPGVIFEIFSPSNEREEMSVKIMNYFKIETVTDVFIVSQKKHHVEHYKKRTDEISIGYYSDPDDAISIPSLNIEFKVSDIYNGIDLEK